MDRLINNLILIKAYFICLLLSISCCELKDLPAQKDIYLFDFSQYTEKGFYFYIEEYPGSYETMGIISIDYYPEYKVKEESWYSSTGTKYTSKRLIKGEVPQDTLLNVIYNEAIDLGANAIYNFEIKSASKIINQCTIINGLNIYGVAIKIK